MNTATSSTVQMNSREFIQKKEAEALHRIPGVRELLGAYADQRPTLEEMYPDAAFALQILSNPFVADREIGAIRMEAYSSILNGESVTAVHYRYDRQMDAYVARHSWD